MIAQEFTLKTKVLTLLPKLETYPSTGGVQKHLEFLMNEVSSYLLFFFNLTMNHMKESLLK